MELVNRETNFNKMFSASPNVGVLNPLSVKVRKNNLTMKIVLPKVEMYLPANAVTTAVAT